MLSTQPTAANVGMTYGITLDGLWHRVDETIQKAANEMRNAGIEILMAGGKEIGLAIENAKNAYKDSLDHTMDKVSKQATDVLDRLKTMVQTFQNSAENEIYDFEREAQQIINTLPLSKTNPQLTSVAPHYLVIDNVAKCARVTFHGNFPSSAKPGFEPRFSFGGKECFGFHKDTQRLQFDIPNSAFGENNPELYSFQSGKLTVPWDDGWFFSHKTEFEYQVGLGILPRTAGTAKAEYVAKGSERITQKKTSATYQFEGDPWRGEQSHIVYQDIYPDAGWAIDVTAPPQLHTTHIHGKYRVDLASITPNNITIKIDLCCKNDHKMGRVQASVDYTQSQLRSKSNKREEEHIMNWRDDVLLRPQENEEIAQVEFRAYDGSTQMFAAPDIGRRSVLKVSGEGRGVWKIWAEPPQMIQLKQSDTLASKEKTPVVQTETNSLGSTELLEHKS